MSVKEDPVTGYGGGLLYDDRDGMLGARKLEPFEVWLDPNLKSAFNVNQVANFVHYFHKKMFESVFRPWLEKHTLDATEHVRIISIKTPTAT